MTYNNDLAWEQAKEVARAGGFKNKWVETIDYYNINNGQNVKIFCAINNKKYRILYILDSNEVLLLDRDNKLVVEEYTTVDESRKIFFFEPEPEKVKRELPDDKHLLGQTEAEFYE